MVRTRCVYEATMKCISLSFAGVHERCSFSNTRWLSVLRVLWISQQKVQPLHAASHWPWKCKDEQQDLFFFFVNNALRHSGYENTQVHRHGTQLNVLMFEFANPRLF